MPRTWVTSLSLFLLFVECHMVFMLHPNAQMIKNELYLLGGLRNYWRSQRHANANCCSLDQPISQKIYKEKLIW